ncbi:MAG: hypothetical protein HYX57_07755 [Chloroflexi bacterium]|nr:hypothetical protein [Chloroflexota bacterium]
MAFPPTPEPPDARPAERGADLSAVPAFLRNRAGASATSTRVVRDDAPAPVELPDVANLPMLGIAPRRLVLIAASVVLAWLVISFGRQVAEASAASSRADDLRAANASLAQEVSAMERELTTIQEQRYIVQAARAFRLGTASEIPFALEANAPPLPADAPGSAAVQLGADAPASPLARWLDVLFGSGG